MNLGCNFDQWLFSSEVYNDMYSSSDDENCSSSRYDDIELRTIREARMRRATLGIRSTNARYSHQDRINSHLFQTYLSPVAKANNVHVQDSFL